MMIKENVRKIRESIFNASPGEDVTLVCVTKHHDIDELEELYKTGERQFGENRVQEFLPKYEYFKSKGDVCWHLIGHLQKNKVKDVVGKVSLIHSVDSIDLMEKISQVSEKKGVSTNILLELNVSGEESKYGFCEAQVEEALKKSLELPGIVVKGFMTMAPKDAPDSFIEKVFDKLREIYENSGKEYEICDKINISILSMGMSQDYLTAIQCKSNLVRIGTAIFQGE